MYWTPTVCRARTYNHEGYKARQGFTVVTGMQILSLQSLLRGQRQGKPVELERFQLGHCGAIISRWMETGETGFPGSQKEDVG